MTDFKTAVLARPTTDLIAAISLEPPAWTRLEPQSVSGDPLPGLEARIHDPVWMLARQWQLGEFEGEDAGTPIAVHVRTRTVRATAWRPGDSPGAPQPARALADGALLDPLVEREPTSADGPGLRQRAEAGAQLLDDLGDAGAGDVRAALIAACPLDPGADDPFDRAAPRLRLLLTGRLPDGERAARGLEAGAPAWLAGAADPGAALDAATRWLAWYRAAVSPLPDPSADSWIDERLEYRFSVRLGSRDAQTVLRAPSFGGGRVDWYDFDHEPNGFLELPDDPPAGAVEEREATMRCAPLRFAGMSADRYWQFEDGQVNMGALESQPHDPARLCLAEFALIYGNDWIIAPLDVDAGTLTLVMEVSYTTTFGERIFVPEADDAGRSGRFRMFHITEPDGVRSMRGLFTPPSALGVIEGGALEEVLLLRDEAANMAWAVERTVQGPSGDARSRGDEPRPAPIVPRSDPGAELDYVLETEVPDHWIPLVPVSVGFGEIALRKGAMVRRGAPVLPRGVLLRPTPLTIRDEELAREGVRVRRVPALARDADGAYLRWISRRVSVGRGEGSSGFGFDWTIARTRAAP